MSNPVGCLYPDTMVGPDDPMLIPSDFACQGVIDYGPGGGGHGALMSDGFFDRYEVAGKWRGVKRVKISTRGQ